MNDLSKTNSVDSALGVVGLGASAGGITALNAFFDAMAPDTGLAFVVVMHLNPDFETHLHELLGGHTDMPVIQAASGAKLQANHVYVIPPDSEITVEDDHLELRKPQQRHPQQTIDVLFRSLAKNNALSGAGVVMSGAGDDGTVGLQEIKQAGGLTLVQDPSTSGYDSMPKSAIRSGVADEVLPLEQIATRLETFADYLSQRSGGAEGHAELDEKYILEVCDLLGEHVKHDFSQYKRPMLSRRIQRRMMLKGFQTPEAYLTELEKSQGEAQALFTDLLISVTAFFRDPAAFARLQSTIAELIEDTDTGPIRIWVPGCATGEEAYSIAIMAAEEIEKADRSLEVQLFATDIDERALSTARAGVYDESIEGQVSATRLERFFTRQNGHYKVIKSIRDMCIFSSHDLVSDPPFSRIDLLSLRNVLIYMEPELQAKVLALLHYALCPFGVLFLGPAENVRRRDNMYRTIDAKHKIFEAKALAGDASPNFPVFDQLSARRQRHTYERSGREMSPHELGRVFQQRLLDRFGPASALVDNKGRVLYFSGRLGEYLEHRSGPVEDHIVELARTELRVHLRTALHKARARDEEVVSTNLGVRIDDELRRFDLVVTPLQPRLQPQRDTESLWMIVFQEKVAPENALQLSEADLASMSRDEVVEQLEAELDSTRDHLEMTIAQLETANEELKSSNEELLSMNEELQSSGEAMQNSKVELQSVNQELEMVNQKLETKVEELDRAHADLQNLFESTRVPTVFLDRQGCIKEFTPTAKEIFRLIEGDLGRPLEDIALRVSGVDLREEVEKVLETLTPREVRVERNDCDVARRIYLLRIHPYRTLDDVIDGAVLTFIDVTKLERTAERLRSRERQQACIAELGIQALTSPSFSEFAQPVVEAVCETLETDACAVFTLREAEQDLVLAAGVGWPDGLVGTTSVPIGHHSLGGYTLRVEGAVIADDLASENRFRPSDVIRENELSSSLSCVIHGARGPYGVLAVFAREESAFGEDDANFLVAVANVIASALTRKDRLEELRASEERMRAMADAVPVLLWLSEPDRRYSWFNQRWLEFSGRTLEDEQDGGWMERLHPEERDRVERLHQNAFAKREPLKADFRLRRADGVYRWMAARAQPWFSPDGEYMGSIGACIDVSERREFEHALQRADELKDDFLAMLGHELRNPLAAITTAVDLLKMLAGDDPKISKVRDILERQSGQMKRLLDGLLDVTRLERGKMRLQHETFDFNKLVCDVLEDWRTRIEAAGLELDFEPSGEPSWINGDRTRLMQVLGNLLSNAIKFTTSPGEIHVQTHHDGDWAEVSIQDTGAGIDKSAHEHIFEPFRQAEQTIDRSQGGLGMGLPLAKGLVEAHGGEIAVDSEGLEKGATFTVRLPLAEAAGEPSQAYAPDLGRRRILIVEDNRDAADLIATVLEHGGHTVEVCHTGDRAVETAVAFEPDAVLCDIGLPGQLDGFDVASALRADERFDQTMLVAMTGYGSRDVRQKSRDAGFDTHLVKPVDLQTIETVLSLGRIPVAER